MRLTLRTLLAYLDDILDETDAHELEIKIDESETATKLAQRIRQIVGQTRLDTPALNADGLSGDANAVAEYLDNTLALEDVPEFERLCLNSDVHLGEVAACHQILTMILGEPAATTAELRTRIHQLGQSADIASAIPATEEVSETQPAEAATDEISSPVEEVEKPTYDPDEHWTSAPDYLKRKRRTIWKPVGLVALIAFCLIFAGLFGMGPLDQNHPLASLFLSSNDATLNSPENETSTSRSEDANNSAAQTIDNEQNRQAPGTVQTEDANESPEKISLDDPKIPATSNTISSDESLTSEGPPPLGEENADVASVIDPDLNDKPAFETSQVDPAGIAQPTTNQPTFAPDPNTSDDFVDLQQPPAVPAPAISEEVVEGNTNVGDLAPEPREIDIINLTPTTDDVAETLPEEEGSLAESEAAVTNEVGKFLSGDQLLARYNQLTSMWDRVAARDSIRSGDQLLVFPVFRPELMLTTGMQLTLIGPTQIRPQPLSEDESPTIHLDFGRAIVETFAQTGSTIHLQWMDHQAIATLADMDSRFAVEVSRQLLPGVNGEREEAHLVTHFYTMSGSVEWQIDDGSSTPLSAGQRLTIVDSLPPRVTTVDEFPAWIDGSDARPRDPEAAKMLSQRVSEDRPISLSLREQAENQRLELRSLAVCSLAFLNEFDPLLNALNDNRLRSYWSEEYQALKRAMVVSPAAAQALRTAMQERHGPEGADLYRLMWGFDEQQLAADGAQKLVSYLDHPSSDFRVVAHENLKSITGRTSLYMPHFVSKTRKRHIFKWKEQLKKGEIVYREPPELSRLLDDSETPNP